MAPDAPESAADTGTPADPGGPAAAQEQALALVADAIGEVMRFWNFKPSMGRIWTVLYLSPEPLDAEEIERLSGLSAGNVSMSLQELAHWGVVQRAAPGNAAPKRRVYEAETDIWKLVGRVFRDRELRLVDQTIAQLERALGVLNTRGMSSSPTEMLRGRFLATRVDRLLRLARVGRRIVAQFASTGNADLTPLREVLGRATVP